MAFKQQFCAVFEHPNQGQSSSQQLLRLHQGNTSIANYSITFCILAADSSFRDGLSTEVQLELPCRDEGLYLNCCIELAIKHHTRPTPQGHHQPRQVLVNRHTLRDSASPSVVVPALTPLEEAAWEPMEVDSSHLLAEARQCHR